MRRFRSIRNLIVIAAVLAGVGYLRMPREQKFTEDLRERKIAHPQIESEIWSEMGQTSLAGAFGGLRSVMASFMSVGAYDHFENNDWYELEKDYEVIAALDPYNSFYWDTGGWHLGWNAASWAKRNQDFSPAKRGLFEMEYLEKGDAFYRQGLKYNPGAEKLWYEMGAMWSNEFKRPDLKRAAEAFKMIRYSRNPVYRRRYLFTITRIPGMEEAAYDEMMRLMSDGPLHFSVPKFRVLAVILGSNPKLADGVLRPRLNQVFQSKEVAYRDLYNYRARIKYDGYYAGNIDQLMKQLIDDLNVPESLNPFITEPMRPLYPRAWREALDKRDADETIN